MKMTTQPELNMFPEQPPFLETTNHDEFMAIVRREQAGEFAIEYVETLRSKNGANNGSWRFKVRWKTKQ